MRAAQRELALAVVTAAVSGALVLWATTRPWAHQVTERRFPLPVEEVVLSGRDVAAWAAAMGFVGLAGAVALLATKTWGRLLVAGLLAIAGAASVAGGLFGLFNIPTSAGQTVQVLPVWPVITVMAGLLLLTVGVLVLVRRGWWREAVLGQRYESPARKAAANRGTAIDGAGATEPARLWDALDRGEDPTRL